MAAEVLLQKSGRSSEVPELSGWCSIEEFRRHCTSFTPCLISVAQPVELKNINPFHSSNITNFIPADKQIEVSCSSTSEFYGHPIARSKASITFAEFLAAFQAQETIRTRRCDNYLFLSQCCVYSTERQEIEIPEMEHFAMQMLPPLISHEKLQSVNLWANIQSSISGLHYDANHNLLLVVQGHKTLYLFPPSATPSLQPYSAYAESPNHSHLSPTAVKTLIANKASEIPSPIKVEVTAGHALFIPEGWWHMVESTECTVALNYWFLSPLQQMLQTHAPHMASYLLRATINALTAVAIDPLLVRDSNSESVEKKSRIDNTDTNNMDTIKTCSVNSNNVSATRNSSSPPSKKQKYSIEGNKKSSSPPPQQSDKDTCSSNIGGVLTNDKAIPDTRVWQTILLPTCENLITFEECWLTAAQEVLLHKYSLFITIACMYMSYCKNKFYFS